MTNEDLQEPLQNPSIVRNKFKVDAPRKNAIAFLKIQEEFGSFDAYLWAYVENKMIVSNFDNNSLPASTEISDALSKDLKKRGMTFVGPTIMYAFMQSTGMVNDHLAESVGVVLKYKRQVIHKAHFLIGADILRCFRYRNYLKILSIRTDAA